MMMMLQLKYRQNLMTIRINNFGYSFIYVCMCVCIYLFIFLYTDILGSLTIMPHAVLPAGLAVCLIFACVSFSHHKTICFNFLIELYVHVHVHLYVCIDFCVSVQNVSVQVCSFIGLCLYVCVCCFLRPRQPVLSDIRVVIYFCGE